MYLLEFNLILNNGFIGYRFAVYLLHKIIQRCILFFNDLKLVLNVPNSKFRGNAMHSIRAHKNDILLVMDCLIFYCMEFIKLFYFILHCSSNQNQNRFILLFCFDAVAIFLLFLCFVWIWSCFMLFFYVYVCGSVVFFFEFNVIINFRLIPN